MGQREMRKVISLIAAMVVAMWTFSGCSAVNTLLSKESPVEDFEYEMIDGEVYITGYTGTDLEICIPKEIKDRPVTVVYDHSFEGYDMRKVIFPDSIHTIGKSAFEDCVCLEEIQFSKSILYIEDYAFRNCDSLEEVELPEYLVTIGGGAFSGCDSLTYLRLPEHNVMEIEDLGETTIVQFGDGPESVSEQYRLYPPVEASDPTVLVVSEGSETEEVLRKFTSDDENIYYRRCYVNYIYETDVVDSKDQTKGITGIFTDSMKILDSFSLSDNKYPVAELNGKKYYYGMPVEFEDGVYEQDDGTTVSVNTYIGEPDIELMVRKNTDSGDKEVVAYKVKKSTVSVNGLSVGDHYSKIQKVFPEATAKKFSPQTDEYTEMDPTDRAEYIVRYYDGKAYCIEDFDTLASSIPHEDYNEFYCDTFMLSIRVEDEYVTGIYFGDYRAMIRGQ